jgi:hypothetical protein
MDLAVQYNEEVYIIEVKLIHYYDTPEEIKKEGLEQITRYRDKVDSSAPAYLIIFDRRPEAKQQNWEQRITWTIDGTITVVGC